MSHMIKLSLGMAIHTLDLHSECWPPCVRSRNTDFDKFTLKNLREKLLFEYGYSSGQTFRCAQTGANLLLGYNTFVRIGQAAEAGQRCEIKCG